jgi:hypothetical protein
MTMMEIKIKPQKMAKTNIYHQKYALN